MIARSLYDLALARLDLGRVDEALADSRSASEILAELASRSLDRIPDQARPDSWSAPLSDQFEREFAVFARVRALNLSGQPRAAMPLLEESRLRIDRLGPRLQIEGLSAYRLLESANLSLLGSTRHRLGMPASESLALLVEASRLLERTMQTPRFTSPGDPPAAVAESGSVPPALGAEPPVYALSLAEIRIHMANVLISLGRLDEASQQASEARALLDATPRSPFSLHVGELLLGARAHRVDAVVHQAMARPERARQALGLASSELERALASAPRHPELLELRDDLEAIEAYLAVDRP